MAAPVCRVKCSSKWPYSTSIVISGSVPNGMASAVHLRMFFCSILFVRVNYCDESCPRESEVHNFEDVVPTPLLDLYSVPSNNSA